MGAQLAVHEIMQLYIALGQVAMVTRETLANGLQHSSRPRTGAERARLQEALDHLASTREGFVLTLRADAVSRPSELRDLVRRVLVDWGWLEELGLSWTSGQEVQRPIEQLIAFAHSVVALGLLPRLPPEQITYPQPARYADIPVPQTPGDILARIEELEAIVWQAIDCPVADLPPEPLRRTYGFFETSAWLVDGHLRAFRRQ